jgi:hypothetical protein
MSRYDIQIKYGAQIALLAEQEVSKRLLRNMTPAEKTRITPRKLSRLARKKLELDYGIKNGARTAGSTWLLYQKGKKPSLPRRVFIKLVPILIKAGLSNELFSIERKMPPHYHIDENTLDAIKKMNKAIGKAIRAAENCTRPLQSLLVVREEIQLRMDYANEFWSIMSDLEDTKAYKGRPSKNPTVDPLDEGIIRDGKAVV